MRINIRSFIPAFNSVYQQIEKTVQEQAELIWTFHKNKQLMDTEQLMELLLEGVDAVVIALDQLQYPQTNRQNVLAVLANEKEVHNPYVLLALNDEVKHYLSLSGCDFRERYGQVSIAGFGPGNPELLTLKAQRLIEDADVILHDDLLDDRYLKQYSAELVYVGKRKGKHSFRQADINRRLYAEATKGKKVLRLKGGDPLIFGRGAEEYEYLQERQVEVSIVPGVTSALAAAAEAVVPLTSRGVSTSVAFTLGHDAIYNRLPKADTLVFYMGASQQQKWARRLIKEGWSGDTPAVCVHNASLPNGEARHYLLNDLLSEKEVLPAPSLLIVGRTAASSKGKAKKWLYTGTDLNYFKEQGEVVHNPLIRINSLPLSDKHKEVLYNLKAFDRLVFASPFAVHEFFKALRKVKLDVRALFAIELSVIGKSTSKALHQYGLEVEPETNDQSAIGLIKSFKNKHVNNETILLPCSNEGLNVLPKQLMELNNQVYEFKVYESQLPDNAVNHNLRGFYGVVLTSPKVVHHFFKLYDVFPGDIKFQVRGAYTKKVLDSYLKKLKLSNPIQVFSMQSELD